MDCICHNGFGGSGDVLHIDLKMKIEPLSQDNIKRAVNLLNQIFVADKDLIDSPANAFHASLHPEEDEEFYKTHGLKTLYYFVVKDDDTSEVIGTTGLYTRIKDSKDVVWLGWYCVVPTYRGKGLGKELLSWTINKAKQEGF